MKANYRISENDYVQANKLYSKLSTKLLITYLALGLVFLLVALFGPNTISAAATGGLIGAILAVILGRFIVSPILAKTNYRKYKAIQEDFGVELFDDGVCFSSPQGEVKIIWSQIFKWRENDKFILIYPMPRIYHIIPKSVQSDGFDLSALKNFLLKQVG